MLFGEHPSRVRFVAHPMLRENMHTTCDVPEELDIVKREWEDKGFDFTLCKEKEGLPWYLDDLGEEVSQRVRERCEREGGKRVKEVVVDEIRKTYPARLETPQNTARRMLLFKQFLREFLS